MAVWQCRLLLALVLLHLALSSPVVRRDVLALTNESAPNPLAELQPLTKSSLLPRRQAETTPAPAGDDEVPEFDPNKISLQVPDELFAPAFNSVNTISTVIGDLIQNTAERFARLVERLKPSFRKSWGYRSKKRQTDKENDVPEGEAELDIEGEPTFFTDSEPAAAQHASAEQKVSPPPEQTTPTAGRELRSSLKTSYTALVDNS